MRNLALALLASTLSTATALGCATPTGSSRTPAAPPVSTASAVEASSGPRETGETSALASNGEERPSSATTWIGAAAESSFVDEATGETLVGVWLDVPEARRRARPPAQVALVVDTSGSMAGTKIANARGAAVRVIDRLRDGDIVSLDRFGDDAVEVVPPTVLSASTRVELARRISRLEAAGSTNLFAGLSLAESRIAAASSSHPLRRIVLVSDGRATVGPTSSHVLGALADRGRRNRAQVAALGVGLDYDERTLDAIAVRSSGRVHHIGDPRELEPVVSAEMDLLDRTLANDAFVEVVPARGVVLEGFEGEDAVERQGDGIRLPLGALFAGQHREALVRMRIVDHEAFARGERPLASVRLRFADAQDGDLERIQEVVARAELSSDRVAREAHANPRTRAIAALHEGARAKLAASQEVAAGDLAKADAQLQAAEQRLVAEARAAATPVEKKRLEVAAAKVAVARSQARAMPAAAPAARRDQALKMNAEAMSDLGY